MESPTVILLLAAAALHAQTGVAVEGKVVSTVAGGPVKRAVVTLRGVETYLCQTDGQGHFALKDVTPGQYEVAAAREGYQFKPEPAITVGPGPASIEAHLVPLAIITGKIADELGDPVPDADVEAMHYRYLTGKKQLQSTAHAKTNDRGEYLLADLAPSRYYLRASDVEHQPPIIGDYTDQGPRRMQVYAPAFYPGTREADRASMLSVAPGSELQHVDLQIHRESVYSIRGRVPSGATVRLIRPVNEPGHAYASRPTGNGQFEIWGVTPGTYAVAGNRDAALFALRKVEVLNDDVEGVDLTHPTSVAVTGTIHGPEVPGMRILLQSDEGAALDVNAPVNSDGAFALSAQPDNYVLRVVGEGAWLKSMRIGDRDVPDHRITPGRLPGAVSLEISTESGEVGGTVKDANGRPAAGINITLVPDQSLPYWPDLTQTAITNGTGAFVLSRVVPGSYRLFAMDGEAGAPLDPQFRKPFEDKGALVQVDSGARIAVQLRVIGDER